MNTLRAFTHPTHDSQAAHRAHTPSWLRLFLLAFLLVALAVSAFASEGAVRSAAATASQPPALLAAQCPGVPFGCH